MNFTRNLTTISHATFVNAGPDGVWFTDDDIPERYTATDITRNQLSASNVIFSEPVRISNGLPMMMSCKIILKAQKLQMEPC